MRSWIRVVVGSLIIASGSGCGKEESDDPCQRESPLDRPQLCLDRESLGFGLEFDQGTYVGTRPQESLIVRNNGLQDLVIESVEQSGDSAFTLDGPTSDVVKGKERAFLRVIFAPTEAREYEGSITVRSNAENAPEKVIALSGLGVDPDAQQP